MNIAVISAAACTVALLLKPDAPAPASVRSGDQPVFSEGGGRAPFEQLSQLLAERDAWLAEVARARRPLPQTRLVCGTTVITAEPEVDPKMVVVHDSLIEHTIRTIQPPLCWEPADD
jgi:hypothetical protein